MTDMTDAMGMMSVMDVLDDSTMDMAPDTGVVSVSKLNIF